MNEKPNYYAIIPANVRYDQTLKLGEKMMYGEITALTSKMGECWASNHYFAKLYDVTPQAISKWIKTLENKNYISIAYEKNGNAIAKRIIKMVSTDIDRVSTTVEGGINVCLQGYQQEIKENNININNTSINNIKENIKRKFIKPNIDDIKCYCYERNNGIDAEAFYDFYESKDWYVGKNKMKDWKACVRTWEKRNGISINVEPEKEERLMINERNYQ